MYGIYGWIDACVHGLMHVWVDHELYILYVHTKKGLEMSTFSICIFCIYRWNCKMPQNVDVKANVKDIKKVKAVAEELSQSDGKLIVQEDTFFLVPNGRLKLREIQVPRST